MDAIIGFSVFEAVLLLQVVAIIGVTFCKLSCHNRWLPSYVLLFLQAVLSLQVADIIGFIVLQVVLSLQMAAIIGLTVFAICPLTLFSL